MKTLLNTEKGEQNRIYKKRRRDVSESKQTNKKKRYKAAVSLNLPEVWKWARTFVWRGVTGTVLEERKGISINSTKIVDMSQSKPRAVCIWQDHCGGAYTVGCSCLFTALSITPPSVLLALSLSLWFHSPWLFSPIFFYFFFK